MKLSDDIWLTKILRRQVRKEPNNWLMWILEQAHEEPKTRSHWLMWILEQAHEEPKI